MSSFTKPLRVEAVDDTDWKIIEEFDYYIGAVDSNAYVSVPAGYITDFASIPRVFWSILPPWGPYGKAAVIHDFLCSDKYYMQRVAGVVSKVPVTRKRADDIFLEAMTVLGVSTATRNVIYAAVRAYAVVSGKNQ